MTSNTKIKAYHITTLILSIIEIVPLILLFTLSFITKDMEEIFCKFYMDMGVEDFRALASYTVTELITEIRVLLALAILAVAVYGVVDSVFGLFRKVSIMENYKFFRQVHIVAIIDFSIITLIFAIITSVIRERAGFESCLSGFVLTMTFMVFALIHGFMAMLPYELSRCSLVRQEKN